MGMAASQARYLQLTARKSDLEYQAQQISQARMMLADSTLALSREYNQQISNRRLFFVPDSEAWSNTGNLPLLTYEAITSGFTEGGLGMRLVDGLGNIVVPVLPATYADGKSRKDYVIDEDVKKSEYLEECIRSGMYTLSSVSDEYDERGEVIWQDVGWQTCTAIRDSLYTEDDGIATANFEVKQAEIQRKDKMLEVNLKRIETEHKAIETEIDSVKKVIEKNTEVFKDTFG